MSFGIRQKLVIAFAATSLLITLIAFLSMLLSFRSGFLQYVNDVRYQSLESLNEVMQEQVVTEADWQGLIRHKRQWDELIGVMLQSSSGSEFLSRPGLIGPGLKGDRPPPPRDHKKSNDNKLKKGERGDKRRPPPRGPEHPFLLLSNDQRTIYGKSKPAESLWLLPVTIDGEQKGYIGLDELTRFASTADQVFVANQTRYFLWIALFSGVIALLMAFVLARWMVSPIVKLDKAMSALMNRDYKANVQHNSRDEIGRLVASFNQLAATLGEYDHTQQKWIADISHELRTPLATLRGEIEAIQEGVRELSVERLESLHEEVLHLQRIVDDLHQLSLSDAGAMRYAFDVVSVVKVVEQLLGRNQALLDQKSLAHDITVIGSESAVYGDADRLAQLFNNLLQNSIRYTDEQGDINITIFFKDSLVNILWEDSTPGVPSGSLDKLFDRLYREEKSRNREKGGSGLGLSICRSIVEAHQGRIIARHSALGGVVMDIELPLM